MIQLPFYLTQPFLDNLYIADCFNHRIRKVTASTAIISTIAGTGTAGFSGDNGQATSAQINEPTGVAVDATGKYERQVRRSITHLFLV